MTSGSRHVVVLDYGSGNVRSAVRMLQRVGAEVSLTADPDQVLQADGLVVPGVGNFHACMTGLFRAGAAGLIDRRLSGGRPVLGICVGMQAMFEGSDEPSKEKRPGLGQWPGKIQRLPSAIVPHMGWSSVRPGEGSQLFAGVQDELFYFVHSYAALEWSLRQEGPFSAVAPTVTWAEREAPFVAAVENGPLCATQFHPEKSGDAGAHLLRNWLSML
ncbi:imidazole glycerol phosphate synthase subunit HisH [Austwickia chelonae]|uniref:imidazole glycerol phosphate synthase subunit HisH n=1 Tax=Austwickia chelonae TaxID=100225 RepID=UPI000E2834FF|nr:imidazole glycerol phosphate synthase subunit HisH [Austwickia chelonae]